MSSTPATPGGALAPSGDELSLVDALDRLLDRGVAVEGDLVLSVADVDLVWLGLRAVLGDARHAPPGARLDRQASVATGASAGTGRAIGRSAIAPAGGHRPGRPVPRAGRAVACRGGRPDRARVDFDEDRTEHGLVKLVLSVVELLRQLLERQALRRVDDPTLDDHRLDRLGCALMRLEERMEDLKVFFGLEDEDLELKLGTIVDTQPRGV